MGEDSEESQISCRQPQNGRDLPQLVADRMQNRPGCSDRQLPGPLYLLMHIPRAMALGGTNMTLVDLSDKSPLSR